MLQRERIYWEAKEPSKLPEKIRRFFTKKIQTVCENEKLDEHETELVLSSSISLAENEFESEPQKNSKRYWRLLWGKVYNEAFGHASVISNIQFEPGL